MAAMRSDCEDVVLSSGLILHGIQQSLMITAASGLTSEGKDSTRIRDQ